MILSFSKKECSLYLFFLFTKTTVYKSTQTTYAKLKVLRKKQEEHSQMIWAPDRAWDWGVGPIATACPAATDVLWPFTPGIYVTSINTSLGNKEDTIRSAKHSCVKPLKKVKPVQFPISQAYGKLTFLIFTSNYWVRDFRTKLFGY